jgi:hypothetical protein
MAHNEPNFSTQISSRKHPRHYYELDASIGSMHDDASAGNASAKRDGAMSPATMNIRRNDSFTLSYEKATSSSEGV